MESMGLNTIGESWFNALHAEFDMDYFIELANFLAPERNSHIVCPRKEDVFSWSRYCPVEDVKVVILGQDPYSMPDRPNGLCYSVRRDIPLSIPLRNVFQELMNDDVDFNNPGHGDLAGWASQGVLLLNSILTVRAHSANSHNGRGWEKFTDAVLRYVNSHSDGIIFILWGAYPQEKIDQGLIVDEDRHHILRSAHPFHGDQGFFGNGHFSQTNALLTEQGKSEIDWSAL